jgi:hypothetical protein
MRALTLFDTPVRLPREMHRCFERFMDFGPEALARAQGHPALAESMRETGPQDA